MRILTTAAMLALIGAGAASAQAPAPAATPPRLIDHVVTTADLAAVCDPSWSGVPRLEAIAYCQGFLTSAGQYHALLYPAGGPARPLFCVPTPGPSIAEAGLSFAAWSRDNSREAQSPALDGFLRWAQARFPCPQPAPPARAARTAR
jgi:hypothetical protein